jgi:transcriptional regulator with XRE-family HTH domain
MKSGQLIKKQRMKLGLSQGDVSKALGLRSAQFISNCERGICAVSMKQVFKLSKILKLNPSDLKEAIISDVVSRLNKEFLKAGGRHVG